MAGRCNITENPDGGRFGGRVCAKSVHMHFWRWSGNVFFGGGQDVILDALQYF